jgi:hypothetical protein
MNLYTQSVKPKMLFRTGRVSATRPHLFIRERLLMFLLCIFMDVTATVILQHCVVESLHKGRDCRMSPMSNIEPMTFRFHVEFSQHLSSLTGRPSCAHKCDWVGIALVKTHYVDYYRHIRTEVRLLQCRYKSVRSKDEIIPLHVIKAYGRMDI